MKKETIEEAGERAVKSGLFKDETLFIAGVKWQQKRMYSEEEAMSILTNSLHSVELKDNKDYSKIYNGMKEWFEKFKKK